MVKIERFAGI